MVQSVSVQDFKQYNLHKNRVAQNKPDYSIF